MKLKFKDRFRKFDSKRQRPEMWPSLNRRFPTLISQIKSSLKVKAKQAYLCNILSHF
jgi:hypothetical protein